MGLTSCFEADLAETDARREFIPNRGRDCIVFGGPWFSFRIEGIRGPVIGIIYGSGASRVSPAIVYDAVVPRRAQTYFSKEGAEVSDKKNSLF